MTADHALPQFPPGAFAKEDGAEDGAFYAAARLETHIDDAAIGALTTNFYRKMLPEGGVILDLDEQLDLASGPDDVAYSEVIGHGMNARELEANPRLSPLVHPGSQP